MNEVLRDILIGNLKDKKPVLYEALKDGYPDLEGSLLILAGGKYKSYGFPIVFLDYNYTFGWWSVSFRNPANFSNPEIKAQTPTLAVHEMLDFLLTRLTNEEAV